MGVCFVDIGGIADHHFKLSFHNSRYVGLSCQWKYVVILKSIVEIKHQQLLQSQNKINIQD